MQGVCPESCMFNKASVTIEAEWRVSVHCLRISALSLINIVDKILTQLLHVAIFASEKLLYVNEALRNIVTIILVMGINKLISLTTKSNRVILAKIYLWWA